MIKLGVIKFQNLYIINDIVIKFLERTVSKKIFAMNVNDKKYPKHTNKKVYFKNLKYGGRNNKVFKRQFTKGRFKWSS